MAKVDAFINDLGRFVRLEIRADDALKQFAGGSVEILSAPRTVPAGCLVISPPLEKWDAEKHRNGEYVDRWAQTKALTYLRCVGKKRSGKWVWESESGGLFSYREDGTNENGDSYAFEFVMPAGFVPEGV